MSGKILVEQKGVEPVRSFGPVCALEAKFWGSGLILSIFGFGPQGLACFDLGQHGLRMAAPWQHGPSAA